MTWTFNDDSNQNRDIVRNLLGQTSTGDDVLVTDEFIAWALSQKSNNLFRASALLARSMARRYATLPESEAVGNLRISFRQRATELNGLADDLEQEASITGVAAIVGGISKSDMRTEEQDTDRVKPEFSIGMDDHPLASQGSTSNVTT